MKLIYMNILLIAHVELLKQPISWVFGLKIPRIDLILSIPVMINQVLLIMKFTLSMEQPILEISNQLLILIADKIRSSSSTTMLLMSPHFPSLVVSSLSPTTKLDKMMAHQVFN